MPALLGDTPSTFQPLDETLRENLQARYSSGKPLGPLRPVLPACCKSCDVAFQIVKACKAVWIAHQNLENCDLEIHLVDRSANHCLYRKGRISLDDMIEAGVDPEIAEYGCRSIGRYHVFDVRASLR